MSNVQERRVLTLLVVLIAGICGVVAVLGAGQDPATTAASAVAVDPDAAAASVPAGTAAPADTTAPTSAATSGTGVPGTDPASSAESPAKDLDGDESPGTGQCTLSVTSLRQGESGDSVTCLQEALAAAGYLSSDATGTFDQATYEAVRSMQEDRELFVDGIVGRESAISLGVWPDEESLVVHTPPPAPGAMDLMGYPLSSVATSGPDAPPLPPNSGSGRRVVYSRSGQRVWAVDENDRVIRSWLVSGSKYSNEMPGTHVVYSRSERSTAWNGKAWLPMMIRYQETRIGHIGFHAIPIHVSDNTAYQTEAELGQRLSGGCQRQANADARFMWDFAQVGTTVVVV